MEIKLMNRLGITGMVLIGLCFVSHTVAAQAGLTTLSGDENAGARERAWYVQTLRRIADPVLYALSRNELREKMPVEGKQPERRVYCSHLEAFGRLLDGMAPWLELGPDSSQEGKIREQYINLSVACIKNAVNPGSPDFLNFYKDGNQPLVDAAFFADALLRAPVQLWGRLDTVTKSRVLSALRSSKQIIPSFTNHMLFSAIVEAALMRFGGSGDRFRTDMTVKQIMLWYKGDGVYGDGPVFHWDYYNSFVIQPMLLQVLDIIKDSSSRLTKGDLPGLALEHAQRYAAILERLIAPDASYPAIGRSLTYRFGAFQLLSDLAYRHELPEDVTPQQVRSALYYVIKRQIAAPGTFDKAGWLRIGFYGYQPGLGENYISTGSLYLCSEAFIALGLPADDPFWQGKDEPWTQLKVWSGKAVDIDHALKD